MSALIQFLKLIFLEKHEVIYNLMMILMSIFVFILLDWLRKAYKILETAGIEKGDPTALRKFSKEIENMMQETKTLTTTLNRKTDDLYLRVGKWDTNLLNLQKNIDDNKKKFDDLYKVSQDNKQQEQMLKTQEEYKEMITNLNKRIEDLYEKTHRFNEQIMTHQKSGEEINKEIVRLTQAFKESGRQPKEIDLSGVTKGIEETNEQIRKVNEELSHLHNKMIEHEEQINDLKRIFEDMDATFAEMNKRFQK